MEPTSSGIISEIREISSQLTRNDFKKLSKKERIVLSVVLEKGVFDKKDDYANSMMLSDLRYKLIDLRDNKTDQPSEKPGKVQKVYNKIKGAHSPSNLEKLAQKGRTKPTYEEHPYLEMTYREEDPISRLNPLEIQETSQEIIKYLPLNDLKSLRVSRMLNALTKDPILKKKMENLEPLLQSREEFKNLVSEAREKYKDPKKQYDHIREKIIKYYSKGKDPYEVVFEDFMKFNIHEDGILFEIFNNNKFPFFRAFAESTENGGVGLDNFKAFFKFLRQDNKLETLYLIPKTPFDK